MRYELWLLATVDTAAPESPTASVHASADAALCHLIAEHGCVVPAKWLRTVDYARHLLDGAVHFDLTVTIVDTAELDEPTS